VGACVGMKGSRVQNVVQELRGEKIDIIPWHADAAKYVCNALSPAEISRVIIDEERRSMEVIVPDEFLSVAIGKKGQNVRLASKLSGWHLDVKSEASYSEAMKSGYDSLMALQGVGIGLADALYEAGFYSAEEISKAGKEDLIQVRGIGEQKADELIALAVQAVKEAEAAAEAEEELAEEEEPAEEKESAEEEEPAEEIETDAHEADSEDSSDSVSEAKDTDDSTDPEPAGDDEPAADSEES